jgi:hypothetical protein
MKAGVGSVFFMSPSKNRAALPRPRAGGAAAACQETADTAQPMASSRGSRRRSSSHAVHGAHANSLGGEAGSSRVGITGCGRGTVARDTCVGYRPPITVDRCRHRHQPEGRRRLPAPRSRPRCSRRPAQAFRGRRLRRACGTPRRSTIRPTSQPDLRPTRATC